MSARLFTFVGGEIGAWRITRMEAVTGMPLARVEALDMVQGAAPGESTRAQWQLRGITSNERYIVQEEKARLVEKQQGLGRPEAVCAALIPIRKSAEWWSLPQDARRRLFEEDSKHVEIGLRYLPAVARRLHHCRDLGEDEPFDFLTWFEYASVAEAAFEELVRELRASPEWRYVDREIDIRLRREPSQ